MLNVSKNSFRREENNDRDEQQQQREDEHELLLRELKQYFLKLRLVLQLLNYGLLLLLFVQLLIVIQQLHNGRIFVADCLLRC